MKAMVIRRYGGPEVLEPAEVPTPRPGKGEVLVRVLGSSVNPVDAVLRSGGLRLIFRFRMPAVLGVDVAGEVAELGEGATRFKVGDRVFAFTGLDRGGGYGEFIALPESFLARVPAKLSWAEAGTVPGVGLSAYEALTVHAPVKPGMKVFITAAAGGVGSYCVQIAKALGAEVTGTCSEAKAALVRELGAAHIVDYTKGDPYAAGHGTYDVVVNNVRGAPHGRLRQLLRPGGTLVSLTGMPPQAVLAGIQNLFSSRKTVFMFVSRSGAVLEGLSQMIDQGQVRPVVEKTFGWSELAEAHRRVETGRVAGKLAVVPSAS